MLRGGRLGWELFLFDEGVNNVEGNNAYSMRESIMLKVIMLIRCGSE